MNFTAKSRYALKIMIDLALYADKGVQQREEIASRAGIPADFMDQITVKLKNYGLIESVRGRRGGYRLARPVTCISAFDIFSAVEGESLYPVACLQAESDCDRETSCMARLAWNKIYTGITDELRSQHLSELVNLAARGGTMVGAVSDRRECLAPRKLKSPDRASCSSSNARV